MHQLTDKEIAQTVAAMHGMIEQLKTFVWPDLNVVHFGGEEPPPVVKVVNQLVKHPAGDGKYIHRRDFAMCHDAWIEQSKEQIYINKLLARVEEYEVRMKDGRIVWPITLLEEFARFIAAVK